MHLKLNTQHQGMFQSYVRVARDPFTVGYWGGERGSKSGIVGKQLAGQQWYPGSIPGEGACK